MNHLKSGVLCLVLTGVMAMSTSAVATTIIYSAGHPIDETAAALGDVFLAAGNPVSGFSTGNLADAIGDGETGIYGPYDALVLGEDYAGFSAPDQAIIEAFTSNGGHTVVLGGHGDEVSFLNETFGYSVTHFAASSTDHTPINRVAGTGPVTLLTLDGSWFVESAPGTLLYQREGGGDAAFVDSYGSGTVSWLAWDFCECGELDSDQADWFSVLGTEAITQPVSAVPVPTLSTYGMLLLMLSMVLGTAFFRRDWS